MLEVMHPGVVCELGGGPRWDAAAGVLRWADLHQARLYSAPWAGRPKSVDIARHLPLGWSSTLSVAVPVAGPAGGLLAVAGTGLVHLTARGGVAPLIPLARPGLLRLNDGACDPAGRLWVGAMAPDVTAGAGALFRVGPAGADRVLSGLTAPNGLGWSPDGRTMYVTDSRPGVITAYDFDLVTGALARPRVVVRLDPREGVPDGLAVDAEGCLWTATWTGRQIRRISPEGRLISAIDVPARQVSSCAFAGPALDALVVTTGRVGPAEPGTPPESGRLFRLRTGTKGLPATPYAGPLPRA